MSLVPFPFNPGVPPETRPSQQPLPHVAARLASLIPDNRMKNVEALPPEGAFLRQLLGQLLGQQQNSPCLLPTDSSSRVISTNETKNESNGGRNCCSDSIGGPCFGVCATDYQTNNNKIGPTKPSNHKGRRCRTASRLSNASTTSCTLANR